MKIYLIITSTSMLLQFLAVYLALNLMRITGKITAWIFIAGAIIFMALRRGLLLYGTITGGVVLMPTDVAAEIIALVTSALMAIGLGLIAPLFLKVTRSEAALQESQKRFRDITENAVEWFWEVDQMGKYTYSSPLVEQLLGYKPDEVIGKHFYDFFLPEEREELKDAALELLGTGKPFQRFINRNLHKRGEIVWLSSSGIPILDGKGNTLGYRGVDIDLSEHKQAEEALQTSEARYRTLVDNIALGISLIGSDHKIIMTNPAMGTLLQKPVSEFVGKECFREFEKRNEVCSHCPGTKAMATGQLAVCETRGVRDDGSLIYVRLFAFPVFGPDGKPTGFIEVVEDITERTEAKDAVQRAEEELRLITRNIPAIVFKGYADGSVDLFDDRVEAMTGYPRAEFDSRQRKWTEVILAEDLMSAKEAFIKALKNTGSYVREYRLRTKTGETIWVQERSYIVRDAEGMIDYISGVFFDVTARRRGEETLRESEERFRGLFETSPDVVAQVDLNLNFLLVNQMAESFFGYKPAHQLIGKSFLDLVDPKDHPKVIEDAQTLLTTGTLRHAEYTFVRQDGTSFPGEVSAALTVDLAGNPKAFTGSIRDITDRRRVQERLEAERQRLFILLESLPAYIYLEKIDHSISFANRFFREGFGDTEGRPCYEVIYGRQEPCEVCPPFQVLESHQPQEWEWTTASGRTFQSFAYPFVDIDGSPLVLVMGLDITVRKQAEDILKNGYQKLRESLSSTVTALGAAVGSRDPYTAGHQQRVTRLACAMARELGLPEDQIEGIDVAGALHDIGKIQVPAEILSKPGKLSKIEFQMIKVHAQVGYAILKDIKFPWPVALAILQHHERLDGSGYPFGLSGPDIILEARILAVADVVEAMSSHRPYRPALGIDKALAEISQNRGIIYDPDVVDACVKLFTEKGFNFEDYQK